MIWTTTYTRVAVGAVAVALGALVLSEYAAHVKADAQAEATIKVQADYQKTLQQQLADLQKQQNDRDAKYQQDKQDLQKQFQGSLQQVIAVIQAKAGLPVPLQVVTPPATAANPNPQPTVVVPSADLPQAKAYVQACEQCSLDRTKLQADAEDRVKQMQIAQQQIDSLKTQRDAAVKEGKGGSWVKRVGKAVEYLVIGAAVGYAAAKR